jgi:hypothetical protein
MKFFPNKFHSLTVEREKKFIVYSLKFREFREFRVFSLESLEFEV